MVWLLLRLFRARLSTWLATYWHIQLHNTHTYALGSDPCGLFRSLTLSLSLFSCLHFPFAPLFSLIEIVLFERFLLCVLFLFSGLCFHEYNTFWRALEVCRASFFLWFFFFIVRSQFTVYSAAFEHDIRLWCTWALGFQPTIPFDLNFTRCKRCFMFSNGCHRYNFSRKWIHAKEDGDESSEGVGAGEASFNFNMYFQILIGIFRTFFRDILC